MKLIPSIENKDVLIFKSLLFIWIMAIPFKNAVYQISVVAIIIFFLVHLFQTKKFNILIENLKNTKYLTFTFICIIISMIVANLANLELLDKKSWHIVYMFVIRYGLIFVILAYFYKLDFFNKKEIISAVLLSLSFLMFTGLYQVIGNSNIVMGSGITGSLDNRNAFGLFMGMGVVLSSLIIKDKKILGLILFLMFSFFMIFSFSRSSWVASTFSIIILIIFNYRKIKMFHFLYVVLFFTFIIALYFGFDSFQNRLSQLFNGNSSGRTQIWMHTIGFIKESMFLGYGIDSWKSLPDTFLNRFPDPHNLFLEILIYTGTLGLIACFSSILVVLSKIFTSKDFILFPIATYLLVVTQFDFGAFGSKELLSFLTIFVFIVYSDSFKVVR